MNGGRHKPITAYYEKIFYVHQILCQKIKSPPYQSLFIPPAQNNFSLWAL